MVKKESLRLFLEEIRSQLFGILETSNRANHKAVKGAYRATLIY